MSPPLLELINVSFAYGNQAPVLNDCTLTIQDGERWHLQGENGSGKSTLFHLLLGLTPWQTGSYAIAGKAVVSAQDYPWLRRKVGLLTQTASNHLFCPTIGDDCRFGPLNQGCDYQLAETRTQHYLDKLGILDYIDCPATQLSGGQLQRAAVAAILCCENNLILLDEPNTGLDSSASQYLIQTLNNFTGAMIVTSHDDDFTKQLHCSPCHLRQGKIRQ